MYHSEVEDWLISIGLQNLYHFFVEDGFTSLDAVRNMRQADIDAIVDRHGYMIILNEEIDKLNYGPYTSVYDNHNKSNYSDNSYSDLPSYIEPIENIMKRYDVSGVPSVGFASQHLARRAKSAKLNKIRGASALPGSAYRESSVSRHIPNSASNEFETFMVANRRAVSFIDLKFFLKFS